jgi:predicted ATP-binding protein involved in virulence
MFSSRIEHLELRNYRRFPQLSIDFHGDLSILVANNGGGKTAVLDAIAIALRYFVDELRGTTSHGFERTDVRLARAPTGAMVPSPPTSMTAHALIDGQSIHWSRDLASMGGRTTYADAGELAKRARSLRERLVDYANGKRPDAPMLPIIAYYGTGRLWSAHKVTAGKKKAAKNLAVQTEAYLDCLSPSSSYGHFVVWFESVVREAQNEAQTGLASPHRPALLLEGIRRATDAVLRPSGWRTLDWDFLAQDVIAQHETQGRLPVSLLSDGIRNLIALVADLAHRAVRLNPHLGAHACLETPGIVLVDEVDMHLHPAWQQTVVSQLREAFPRVQFILTTHSHLVTSTVHRDCIRILHEDGTVSVPSDQTQGADSPFVLGIVFGVDTSPPIDIAETLSKYRALIEQGYGTQEQALALKGRLTEHFGLHHPTMLATEGLLRLQRFKSERARQG